MTAITPTDLDLRIEDAFYDLEFGFVDGAEALSELRRQVPIAQRYLEKQNLPAHGVFKSHAEAYDHFAEQLSGTMRHLASYILARGKVDKRKVLPLTTPNIIGCIKTAVAETEDVAYGRGKVQTFSLSQFKDFEPEEVRQVDRDYHGRFWNK